MRATGAVQAVRATVATPAILARPVMVARRAMRAQRATRAASLSARLRVRGLCTGHAGRVDAEDSLRTPTRVWPASGRGGWFGESPRVGEFEGLPLSGRFAPLSLTKKSRLGSSPQMSRSLIALWIGMI